MIEDTQEITKAEMAELEAKIRCYPLTTFQLLNLHLNRQGFCISISHLSEWDKAYESSRPA